MCFEFLFRKKSNSQPMANQLDKGFENDLYLTYPYSTYDDKTTLFICDCGKKINLNLTKIIGSKIICLDCNKEYVKDNSGKFLPVKN